MRLPASILNSALIFITVLLLFSFDTMKIDDSVIKISINWNNNGFNRFSVEGATYPKKFNGLPLLSIQAPNTQIAELEILNIYKSEATAQEVEILVQKYSKDFEVVTFRHLKDRDQSVVLLDIIPIQYDSTSGKYFKIYNIEIGLKAEKSNNSSTNLRTGGSNGNSVLASGEWFKIPVTETGVYKLDYKYLKDAGVDLAGKNPNRFKIYGNGGGMLPQINRIERPVDLTENAIYISGESDGRFDAEDFVLFYGQGPNDVSVLESGELFYKKNFYSDTSFYFFNISEGESLRIKEKEDLGANHPMINQFDDYIIYEKDEINIINSGRDWYGEKFDFTLTYDLTFDFPGLVPNTELIVTSAVMGQTYAEASLDLKVNGAVLGQQNINNIVEGYYLAKGSNQVDDFTINTSDFPPGEKITVQLSFNPTGTGKSAAYLNYLKVFGKRELKLFGNQMRFRSVASTGNAISSYTITNAASTFKIWDITNPLKPYIQKFSLNSDEVQFGAFSSELREFIIFNNAEYLIPGKTIKINNQNLHGAPNVDLLIVSYPGFLSEAERLADLRRSHDGLDVLVVTTREIYNEFSSGKQDVTAIRDFIRFLYNQGTGDERLQNVLLFGKGSFDYKDRIDKNTNFVPIYTSRNSLHPINSYSSDDYYGFLNDDEGEWEESYSGDQLMDIGVGRLPVKSIEEARIMVDKLYNYATNEATFGPWRNELIFIADDGDGNLHQRDADRLTNLVDTSYTQFNVNKIYMDAYEQVNTSIGESAPGVNEAIERSIEKGALMFNFTGHGSATRWTSETILNISSVSAFKNRNKLPLFVTATCEFGRHDNPKAISGAEFLLLNPEGGAIGLLTTARPVFSSTNFILNKAFYKNVFKEDDSGYRSLGEIFRNTKNQSLNGSVNRNFSLLADPSMTLAYATEKIVLKADEDTYQPGDTLSALSPVKLKGNVINSKKQVNGNFNGKLTVTVFDQPSEIQTLGNEDRPMKFLARDNILFKGEVSVDQGEFYIEFIVPKNITYDFEKGKISMYAVDMSHKFDAAGSDIEFIIGGESDDFIADSTPPEIKLFINDTSFVNGGITGPDILLVAKLSDESGISISNSESGEELTAILDDSLETVVNEYYLSEGDTYKKGLVTYPYKNLSIGTHKIQLKAWDTHNNENEAEIEFLVVTDEKLAIEKLINFPNPFSDYTQFSFEHNRAGDDLEIMIDVYSTQGKLVKQFVIIKENSESRISDLFWDGRENNGSKLLSGVYIFKLSIRSLNDGSKKQENQKLVIIN